MNKIPQDTDEALMKAWVNWGIENGELGVSSGDKERWGIGSWEDASDKIGLYSLRG